LLALRHRALSAAKLVGDVAGAARFQSEATVSSLEWDGSDPGVVATAGLTIEQRTMRAKASPLGARRT